MSSKRNWKDTFRDAIAVSEELTTHKIHRDLIAHMVHKANQQSQFCWLSQAEMARHQGCSERNVKDLLQYLQEIGAVYPVRFSQLPARNKADINSLCRTPMNGNSNVYFMCDRWASDMLAEVRDDRETSRRGIEISEADRRRGREKANAARARYIPAFIRSSPDADFADAISTEHPEYEDYLFLNAVPQGGSPTTPIFMHEGGSPTTGRYIEDNRPGFQSSLTPPDTEAILIEEIGDSQHSSHAQAMPRFPAQQNGCSDGEAVAMVPRAMPLAGFGAEPHKLQSEKSAGARARRSA